MTVCHNVYYRALFWWREALSVSEQCLCSFSLQCRWAWRTRGCACLTPPSGDGDTSAHPAPISFSLPSAVRRWASSGNLSVTDLITTESPEEQINTLFYITCYSRRAINFSVTCAPDSSGSGHEFFCIKESELNYGKKISTALYPWWDVMRAW